MNVYALIGVLAVSLVRGAVTAPPELNGWAALASGFETYADGNVFTFVLTLFLAQNVGLTPVGPSWHGPSWSISVEFYAALFLFFWIGLWRDNRNTTFVAPTLILALVCILAVVNGEGSLPVSGHDILPWVNYGLMRGLSEIAIGILAILILPMVALPRWPLLYFRIVVALSWLTWRWIEVPAQRAINRRLSRYIN